MSIDSKYGKELSNRKKKPIEVSSIQQSVMSYNILPDIRKNNGSQKPPRVEDSPSVCEILNRGD